MNEWWRWLLDLERIPADAEIIRMGWERQFPAWVWVLAIFGLGLFAFWSYSGLAGNRKGRGIMAMARFGLLFALVILLAGPTLIVPRERIERDWVIMLVDRSQSMQIEDLINPLAPGGQRLSRDAQLDSILADFDDSLTSIRSKHNVAWVGFGGGAFDLGLSDNTKPQLGDASETTTAIEPALRQALRRLAARPISGVVLFSDGRTTHEPGRALLRQLGADAVQVFTVPLGSPDPVGDMAIDRVNAPSIAFVHDEVPVEIELARFGLAQRDQDVHVELVDTITGEILDETNMEPGQNTVMLSARPIQAGTMLWEVRIDPDGHDLVEENNVEPVTIELVDRPLRVLYIEGYPRWEYRYLKNLLVLEPSIDSSVMLLSADRDFAQEGNTPIARLPNSPEEWSEFDVVIIGDVHGEFFTPSQLEMMRNHVAERGAGLLWLPGPRANPATYADTEIAPLLPVRNVLTLGTISDYVTMEPTNMARRLGVLRLQWQDKDAWSILSDPALGWTQFKWALRVDREHRKPAAEALAVTSQPGPEGETLPLVLHMRFGSGQTMFIATDEIWRWRYGRGEHFTEQFWIQIIRMLSRDRLSVSGRSALISVTPRRAEIDQALLIEMRLLDAQLADQDWPDIPIEIMNQDTGDVVRLSLVPVEGAPGRYRTTYLADRAGDFIVRSTEPGLRRLDLVSTFNVQRLDDERRRPEADHDLLARLAEQTGGRVLDAEGLKELPDLLKNRSVRTPMDIVEPIWDAPLTLIVIMMLLTLEWVGRKRLRLL